MPDPVRVWCTAKSHNLLASQIWNTCPLSGYKSQRTCHFHRLHHRCLFAINDYTSAVIPVESGYGLQQGGFAGPVASDESRELSTRKFRIHVFKQIAAVVPD